MYTCATTFFYYLLGKKQNKNSQAKKEKFERNENGILFSVVRNIEK